MYKFEPPLEMGKIVSRPNRFIMKVEKDENIFECHCPTTGKIGTITLEGLPCLLSKSSDAKRKTAYTVEAIFIDNTKSWVGINQNAVNRYVEYFFKNGSFDKMIKNGYKILREQKIGNSKLDFKIENTYIEVKTPLMYFPCMITDTEIPERNVSYFERFIKHVTDLSHYQKLNGNAILLTCFLYDAPKFLVPKPTPKNKIIRDTVWEAVKSGVKMWQINMNVDLYGVSLLDYFEITHLFENQPM